MLCAHFRGQVAEGSVAVTADCRRHVHCLDVPSSEAEHAHLLAVATEPRFVSWRGKQTIEDQSQKALNAFCGVVSNDSQIGGD
jgi:hypothetical protein